MAWWETLFDEKYLRFWKPSRPPERTAREVDGIVRYLALPEGAAVLDLACGYGRIAIPLAQRGYHVTGLDLSEILLSEACRAGEEAGVQVAWHRGDMRNIPWADAFDAVISIYTSFGYFEEEADNQRVLEGVYRALKPGGRFLLDVSNRDWRVQIGPRRHWFEVDDCVVLVEAWLDLVAGRSGETWRWREGGTWRSLEFDVRLYTATELKRMIEAAGMRWLRVYGGWEDEDFGPQVRRIIAITERPSRSIKPSSPQ